MTNSQVVQIQRKDFTHITGIAATCQSVFLTSHSAVSVDALHYLLLLHYYNQKVEPQSFLSGELSTTMLSTDSMIFIAIIYTTICRNDEGFCSLLLITLLF